MPAVARVGDFTILSDTIITGSQDVYVNEGAGGPPSISGIAAVNAVMDSFAQPGVDRVVAAAQHDDDPGSDFTYTTYRRSADKQAGLADSTAKVLEIAPPPTGTIPDIAVSFTDIDSHVGSFPGTFQLSTNFTLAMLTTDTLVSNYVLRAQVSLTEKQIVSNLRALCVNILEPLKLQYGAALVVNSAFRHGNGLSQHYKGQAVDISFANITTTDDCFIRAKDLQNLVNFDQFIYEQNNTIWFHLSYSAGVNRKQILSKPRGDAYLAGLLKIFV